MGNCGTPTKYKDFNGFAIDVGDILTVWNEEMPVDHLTAMVDSSYTTYTNGEIVLNVEETNPLFVMGIKSCCEDGEFLDRWNCLIVKKWNDIVDGEHWKDFGFRYSKD